MPAVRLDRPPVAPREYIPWLWIYTPLFFKWMWLSLRYRSLTLPTVTNPNIETGGMRGESKTSYLRQIGAAEQRWVAASALLRFPEGAHPWPPLRIAEAKMAEAGLGYPLIAKPDIGSCGYGVRLIRDRDRSCGLPGAVPARPAAHAAAISALGRRGRRLLCPAAGRDSGTNPVAGLALLPACRRRWPCIRSWPHRRRCPGVSKCKAALRGAQGSAGRSAGQGGGRAPDDDRQLARRRALPRWQGVHHAGLAGPLRWRSPARCPISSMGGSMCGSARSTNWQRARASPSSK